MKPTFQITRQNRRAESLRSVGQINKSPATDWSFQSGADLRQATASSSGQRAVSRGLYALTQGYFDAKTKWEDRIEGAGLAVVIALASWPIIYAIYIATQTV